MSAAPRGGGGPAASGGGTWTWALRKTAALARRHPLTADDASHLELAIRLGLPFTTLNAKVRAAATAEGVPLLGL